MARRKQKTLASGRALCLREPRGLYVGQAPVPAFAPGGIFDYEVVEDGHHGLFVRLAAGAAQAFVRPDHFCECFDPTFLTTPE